MSRACIACLPAYCLWWLAASTRQCGIWAGDRGGWLVSCASVVSLALDQSRPHTMAFVIFAVSDQAVCLLCIPLWRAQARPSLSTRCSTLLSPVPAITLPGLATHSTIDSGWPHLVVAVVLT